MIEIIKTVGEMQDRIKKLRNQRKRIGLVPTMGYLHDGHLSLIQLAREKSDKVVTSIFVNPTQFGPNEDFLQYPRDLERDARLAEGAGCDIIFCPSATEMYPSNYFTYVDVREITDVLCGRSRPGHFTGVTTVVCKLFNIVKPHIAVFGQKDAQQAIVIRQMVQDLNFDLEIIVAPTIREEDGLAQSSRNELLAAQERKDATVLYRALQHAKTLVNEGITDPVIIKNEMKKIISRVKTSAIDYIAVVDNRTLQEIETIRGEVLIALAVKVGAARLIDNMVVTTAR
jgi:pantoate--beta-alanine ligase